MRKTFALAGLLGLLLSLSGCGQIQAEAVLSETEANLQEVTKTLNQLTAKLKEALKNTSGPLDEEKLDAAIKEARQLKEAGEKMLATKVKFDTLQQKVSEAERLELLERYKSSLAGKIESLNSAYESLTGELAVVEQRSTKEAARKLHEALREGKEKFEIIVKRG